MPSRTDPGSNDKLAYWWKTTEISGGSIRCYSLFHAFMTLVFERTIVFAALQHSSTVREESVSQCDFQPMRFSRMWWSVIRPSKQMRSSTEPNDTRHLRIGNPRVLLKSAGEFLEGCRRTILIVVAMSNIQRTRNTPNQHSIHAPCRCMRVVINW